MARASRMAKSQTKPEQTAPQKPKELSDEEVLAQSALKSAARRGRKQVSFRPKGGGELFPVPAVLTDVLNHIRQGFLPAL